MGLSAVVALVTADRFDSKAVARNLLKLIEKLIDLRYRNNDHTLTLGHGYTSVRKGIKGWAMPKELDTDLQQIGIKLTQAQKDTLGDVATTLNNKKTAPANSNIAEFIELWTARRLTKPKASTLLDIEMVKVMKALEDRFKTLFNDIRTATDQAEGWFINALFSMSLLVILTWGDTALAWTTTDCKDAVFAGQIDCFSESLVVQQQTLPNGKQPSEAQRMARVKEILGKQNAPRPIQKPSDKTYQYCEQLLHDFTYEKNFKPIEPVAVLDSPWTYVDQRPEPRVPKEWNQCISPSYVKRAAIPFHPTYLRASIPPYRLYKIGSGQRPSRHWRHVIELKAIGHERYFHAVSLDRCETFGGLYVTRERYALPGESTPPQQAHALTQYQGELMAVSVIAKTAFVISKVTPDTHKNKMCHWSF